MGFIAFLFGVLFYALAFAAALCFFAFFLFVGIGLIKMIKFLLQGYDEDPVITLRYPVDEVKPEELSSDVQEQIYSGGYGSHRYSK